MICTRLPAEWWHVGDDANRLAILLCRVCPFLPRCDNGRQYGVIRAGVAWSNDGRPLPLCACDYPNTTDPRSSVKVCRRCAPPAAAPLSRKGREWLQRRMAKGPLGVPLPPREPKPRRKRGPRVLRPCGTISAARRHREHGEELDAPCLEAQREYYREWKRKARAA
jgi:hypothetical protein